MARHSAIKKIKVPSISAMVNYTPFDTLEIWKKIKWDLAKSEYFVEMYDTCFCKKKQNKLVSTHPLWGRGVYPKHYATIPTVAQNSFEVGL